jgi:16S rRNA (uracil1498-N3)-methyltransferase
MMGKIRTRLFVKDDICENQTLRLEKQHCHFLRNVLRLKPGEQIALFNGKDGEWLCQIEELTKGNGAVLPLERLRPQHTTPRLRLCFAPIKKDALNFVIEKATELGVTELQPVITRYTNTERVRTERLLANAIEASEQCGRLDVPVVCESIQFSQLIKELDISTSLLACVETGETEPIAKILGATAEASKGIPSSILIGPEGGFSEAEIALLQSNQFVLPVGLGPRILRADTAAVAALVIVQSNCGDWSKRPENC